MTSPKKTESNRRNARKSTGPKTPQGKAVSKLNAMKHGILGQDFVNHAPGSPESAGSFNLLLKELIREHQPVGVTERLLVERIAICMWRLRRAYRAEKQALQDAANEAKSNPIQPKIRYIRVVSSCEHCRNSDSDDDSPNLLTSTPPYSQTSTLPDPPPNLPAGRQLDKILKYETTIERQLYRAIHQLQLLQLHRQA